jgi:hypothetical protein
MTKEFPRAKSKRSSLLFREKLGWDLVRKLRKLEWRGFLMKSSEKFSGRFEGSRFECSKVWERNGQMLKRELSRIHGLFCMGFEDEGTEEGQSLHFSVCQLSVVRGQLLGRTGR